VVQSYKDEAAYTGDDLAVVDDVAAILASTISRELADQAERAGEGRFAAITETSNDGIINVDSRGKIIFWNKAAENMFGYSAAEAVDKPFSLVVPEGFLQAHVDGLMRTVSSEGQGYVRANVEGIGLRKDESEFPMELSIGAWRTDEETFFSAIVRDITARKQAEEELQFLGSIPLQVSDALIVTDLNFRVTYVNKAAEYLYDYPGEELIGKTLDLLSAEPWTKELEEEIHRTASSGRVWTGALMNRRKNGSTFLVQFRVSPLRDRQGRLSSYISIFHDMTERKRAEQLLQTLNAAALGMERHLTSQRILEAVAEELERVGLSCAVLLTEEKKAETRVTLRYLSRGAVMPKAGDLEVVTTDGMPISSEAADPLARAIRERTAIFLERNDTTARDAMHDGSWNEAGALAKMLFAQRSILAPLVAGGDVIGVLAVLSPELTRKDTPAITAFANQLAAALRKANLMQKLENSVKELKRTQDILLHAEKMEAIGNLGRGARLQQPPHRHRWLRSARSEASRSSGFDARRCHADPEGDRAGGGAHRAAPGVQPQTASPAKCLHAERRGRQPRQDAAAADRRGRRARCGTRAESPLREGRSFPDRAGPHEPGDQQPRCHAGRRNAHDHDTERRHLRGGVPDVE